MVRRVWRGREGVADISLRRSASALRLKHSPYGAEAGQGRGISALGQNQHLALAENGHVAHQPAGTRAESEAAVGSLELLVEQAEPGELEGAAVAEGRRQILGLLVAEQGNA